MDNFLKPKLAFSWSLFSSYSIFSPSLNLPHLIPHHGSCNTFGPSLWPFFVFHGGRWARLMDLSSMAARARVCDCGAVYWWGRYLASQGWFWKDAAWLMHPEKPFRGGPAGWRNEEMEGSEFLSPNPAPGAVHFVFTSRASDSLTLCVCKTPGLSGSLQAIADVQTKISRGLQR